MRAAHLVKVAAQAEVLRLQHMLKRQTRRAAYGLVVAVFALGVIALANVAGWQVLLLYVSPIYATLILLGINLVIAAIFGLLAARSSPSRTEQEALDLRRRALHEARSSLALGALVPIAGALLRSRRSSSGGA
jgi:hypothetical protein